MSLVVVMGATGTQGGSVARTLAKNPAWKVRGVTRNPSSDKSKELDALGIEIVTADLNQVTTLAAAFEGAEAVFAVTNYWEIAVRDGLDAAAAEEFQQIVNIAHAAKDVPTLRHLVISVMPHSAKLSGGKLPCPHWDCKAKGAEYIRSELPQLAEKTTSVWLGWYVDNMANMPSQRPYPYLDKYIFAQPSKPDGIVPVAGLVAMNTGIVVEAVLAQPEKTREKSVPILTDLIPWTDVVAGWSQVTGKAAVYAELSDSQVEKLWGPVWGPEMARQFRFSEQHPDWYSFYPRDTVSIQELGIGDKVVGFLQALELLKKQLI